MIDLKTLLPLLAGRLDGPGCIYDNNLSEEGPESFFEFWWPGKEKGNGDKLRFTVTQSEPDRLWIHHRWERMHHVDAAPDSDLAARVIALLEQFEPWK